MFLSLHGFFSVCVRVIKHKKALLCPFFSLIPRSLPLTLGYDESRFDNFLTTKVLIFCYHFALAYPLQCSIESPFGELRVWSVTWRFLGPSTFPKRSFVNENYLPFSHRPFVGASRWKRENILRKWRRRQKKLIKNLPTSRMIITKKAPQKRNQNNEIIWN